jgi:hypothetical protein
VAEAGTASANGATASASTCNVVLRISTPNVWEDHYRLSRATVP